MESTVCCVCGSGDSKKLFAKKDKFGISPEEFNVVSCNNCGFYYVNPRPAETQIAKFYPETYSWKELSGDQSLLSKIINSLEKIYRFHLLKYEINKVIRFTRIKKGRVLDIGCGAGDRLLILRNRGYDTYGVEISSSAAYAKEKLKLKVFNGVISNAGFADNFFDVVTLYNVLEHLHDPRKLLREARRVIKDSGFIILEVPNSDSLQYRFFKSRWAAFDLPRDLSYFSPKHLKKILNDEGFVIEKIDHWSSWWHPPMIVISLFPGLDPQLVWRAEAQKGNKVLKRLFWVMWTLILPPFAWLESLLGKGASIVVYAKKR